MENRTQRLRPTEVFVVVAVLIGVLALLSNSLVASREHARSNFCSKNLRRFDQAIVECRGTLTDHTSWPQALHRYLEISPLHPQVIQSGNAFDIPRPSDFTCPSQPMLNEEEPIDQQAHYLAIVENRGTSEETWRFRDRATEDLADKAGHWTIGITIPAASDHPTPGGGPHANGTYLQSDGQGNVTVIRFTE